MLERQLDLIEHALQSGDLDSARRQVRAIRQCVVGTPEVAPTPAAIPVELTRRELATLHLLPDGSMSQKDIARELGVTRNTLKTHLKSLYLKLGAHCRGEAIQRARDFGILPLADEVERSNPSTPTMERTSVGG